MLSDIEIKEYEHRQDEGLRREFEKKPKEDVKSTIPAPDNNPEQPLREGDDGLGIPQSRIEGARALTDTEIKEYEHRQDEELRHEFERKLEELGTGSTSFNLPAGVLRVITWIGWGVASVLGLFLVAQGRRWLTTSECYRHRSTGSQV